jgi:tRNA A37 methylthiotransferase MiaB
VGALELLDKFGIFPYLTRNDSPVLQTLQNIEDKELQKRLHKLTFIKSKIKLIITDQKYKRVQSSIITHTKGGKNSSR